ncbi:MAG: aspartate kinase [Myxococcales bacterium]|nr:aspartate kinase [Myxococcales bacterium]
MATIVQKFGGTSVGTIERIKRVAERAVKTHRAGHKVVVVVSAMSGETNRLLGLAGQLTDAPHHREIDVLVSSGEQVSIGLVALACCQMGAEARSYLGHQVRITTDDAHGMARIRDIDADSVVKALDRGEIVVVAGFQGVNADGGITTLGRGGSDLSAVAMAAAVKADVCEIYTDVDGIYTTDPRVVKEAQKIERITFQEMLELASLGAKVLQTRSVEFAMKYKVPIHVRSSFDDSEGSWVVPEEEGMEGAVVTGVAFDRNTAKLTVLDVPDKPGTVAALLGPLGEAGINVDVIIQNTASDGRTDVTFTVSQTEMERAVALADGVAKQLGANGVTADAHVAKVSVVGAGMRSEAGVAVKMFTHLGTAGVNIQLISTSEIKISCIVDENFTELAVRVLHDAFRLHEPTGAAAE